MAVVQIPQSHETGVAVAPGLARECSPGPTARRHEQPDPSRAAAAWICRAPRVPVVPRARGLEIQSCEAAPQRSEWELRLLKSCAQALHDLHRSGPSKVHMSAKRLSGYWGGLLPELSFARA